MKLYQIESDIIKLILRISDEKGKIDKYTQGQILVALFLYEQKINKLQNNENTKKEKYAIINKCQAKAQKDLVLLKTVPPPPVLPVEELRRFHETINKIKSGEKINCREVLEFLCGYLQNFETNVKKKSEVKDDQKVEENKQQELTDIQQINDNILYPQGISQTHKSSNIKRDFEDESSVIDINGTSRSREFAKTFKDSAKKTLKKTKNRIIEFHNPAKLTQKEKNKISIWFLQLYIETQTNPGDIFNTAIENLERSVEIFGSSARAVQEHFAQYLKICGDEVVKYQGKPQNEDSWSNRRPPAKSTAIEKPRMKRIIDNLKPELTTLGKLFNESDDSLIANNEEFDQIELNVINLIIRLSEQKKLINNYIKEEIIRLLATYYNYLHRLSNNKETDYPKQRFENIKSLIWLVKDKLENFPTTNKSLDKKLEKTIIEEFKEFINNIKKTEGDENDSLKTYDLKFDTIFQWLQFLNDTKSKVPKKISLKIMELPLEYFTKSSRTCNILEETILDLHYSVRYVRNCDIQMIADLIPKLKQKYEEVTQKISECQYSPITTKNEEEPSNIVVNNNGNIASSANESLELFENGANQTKQYETETNLPKSADQSDKSVMGLKQESISKRKTFNEQNKFLKIEGNPVLLESSDIGQLELSETEKCEMHQVVDYINTKENNKILETETKLETKTDQDVLEKVEREISLAMESLLDFSAKQNTLILADQQTDELKSTREKYEIKNRIRGFLIAETMNYLAGIKQRVDHYKVYAQEFAYPETDVDTYSKKKHDILHLKTLLKNVKESEACIESRKRLIGKQIDYALEILKSRAQFNTNIITLLNGLKKTEKSINDLSVESSSQSHFDKIKFNRLLEFHSKIASVPSCHYRLCVERNRILQKLHTLENSLCSMMEIKDIKSSLNKYEADIVNYVDFRTEPVCERREKILKLQTKSKEGTEHLDYNFEVVLGILDKIEKELGETENFLEEWNMTEVKDLDQIRKFREKVSMVPVFTQKENILNIVNKSEVEIIKEHSRRQLEDLSEDLDKHVTVQSEDSLDSNLFKVKINDIFQIMESIKDLTYLSPELDSKKESLLLKVFEIVKILNDQVGNYVMGKKLQENILELGNNFLKINVNSSNVPRENLDFVRLVENGAKYFEPYIDCYLGTRSSTDYYVIEENLLRLLDELGTLNSRDNNLINYIVKTRNYIKQLLKRLEENAINDH